ncbi:hypothetical protein Tco_0064735 [Tanacetum coccineum]
MSWMFFKERKSRGFEFLNMHDPQHKLMSGGSARWCCFCVMDVMDDNKDDEENGDGVDPPPSSSSSGKRKRSGDDDDDGGDDAEGDDELVHPPSKSSKHNEQARLRHGEGFFLDL